MKHTVTYTAQEAAEIITKHTVNAMSKSAVWECSFYAEIRDGTLIGLIVKLEETTKAPDMHSK